MDFIKIIQEGKVDDFKAKYSQKFGGENVNKILGDVSQKYLDWIGKNFDSVNFDENFPKLAQALTKFEKTSTNFPITDLYQYKSVDEFFKAVDDYDKRQRRDIKRMEGGNIVYDDGRYFVVNPLTQQASCYYGKGTKWCTASEGTSHFQKYNEDGKLFYILDRKAPTSNKFYKVALLKKFDGDKTFYDAVDEPIRNGWLINTGDLDKIMTTIDEYMNVEYAEQLKIYADKELAIKEREKNERLRTQRILQQRREAAEERRLDNWWSLDDPACPEEGLKAHALLNVLVDNADVDVMTNADRGEIARLENEIQRLQTEYDNDEVPRPELLDEISDLEDELDELTKKIDVYNIIPTGAYYDTQEFEVIDSPEVEGRTYAVGDEDEMESSARDYVVQLIDDIGYEGFGRGFISNHIDEDAVIAYAEDLYEQDVRDSPESYIDESERLSSKEQEEEIQILKDKISNIKSLIDRLDSHMDEDNEDEVQERIDGLNENIEEINDEITEIEENPDGDYPEDEIEAAIESRVKDVKYDVENFMNEFGLDIENYIDKDSLVQDVVDTDGYGHTLNSYDGTADETYVQDKLYYVMRIN
jgi:hypothetical protein